MKLAWSGSLLLLIALGSCSAPVGPRAVEFRAAKGHDSESFTFDAHQTATGEVSGRIVSRSLPGNPSPYAIEGRVTCVRVVGNRASIGGNLQLFFFEDWPDPDQYHGWYFYVEDNRDNPGVPDRIGTHIYITTDPTTKCPTPPVGSATEDVTDGNVVVSEGVATGSR